jgi:hypothetical protein
MPGTAWAMSSYLHFLGSWDYRYLSPMTSFYLLRWGLWNFLPMLALNLNPLDLHFLSNLGLQA